MGERKAAFMALLGVGFIVSWANVKVIMDDDGIRCLNVLGLTRSESRWASLTGLKKVRSGRYVSYRLEASESSVVMGGFDRPDAVILQIRAMAPQLPSADDA